MPTSVGRVRSPGGSIPFLVFLRVVCVGEYFPRRQNCVLYLDWMTGFTKTATSSWFCEPNAGISIVAERNEHLSFTVNFCFDRKQKRKRFSIFALIASHSVLRNKLQCAHVHGAYVNLKMTIQILSVCLD